VYEDVWEYLRYLIVNGVPINKRDDSLYTDQKFTLNPGFKSMLDQIESIATRELESGDMDEASLIFETIMKLEIGFWNMAFEMGRLEDFN
jgi:thiaminase